MNYVDTKWNAGLRGDLYDIEHRIIADGKTKWVREKAYLEFDPENKLLGGFGITQDITEKKNAEEALQQAAEEWARTFDSVPDLISIIDKNHTVIRANKALAQRLGLTTDQCKGIRCYEAIHGLSCAPGFCPHSQTIFDGETHTSEVHEPHLNSDFLVSTAPLTDNRGNFIGSVHVARDITLRKQLEQQLVRSRDALEELVMERTADLVDANERLKKEIRERIQKEKDLIKSHQQLRALTHRVDEVAEAERMRISREIHDELGHLLTVIKYDIEGMMNKQEFAGEPVKTDFESLKSMIESLIDTVRKIATDLRPGILDHPGLIPAIDWHVKQFRKRSKISCQFEPDESELTFSKNETTIIFRIFQEILTQVWLVAP